MITEVLLIASVLSAGNAELVQEVICAETRFSRAAERKDPTAFLAMVDSDARFVTDATAHGHAEILESWAFAFADNDTLIRWRPAVVEVSSDGMLALSRGPFRLTGTDEEGAEFEIWGTFISTWRRNQEGAWRVIFDTGSENNMTPTDADIETLYGEPACD